MDFSYLVDGENMRLISNIEEMQIKETLMQWEKTK